MEIGGGPDQFIAFADKHAGCLARFGIKHLAHQARLASAPSASGRFFVELHGQKIHGMASLPEEGMTDERKLDRACVSATALPVEQSLLADPALEPESAASALFPKFVIHRSTRLHELRKAKGTSKPMILVPFFDLKFLIGFAATGAGTSNRRHWCGGFDVRFSIAASPRSDCQIQNRTGNICLLVSLWL